MNRRQGFVVAVCLMLAGCGGGRMADLEEFVQRVKQREPGQIEPLPEIRQIDTFVYEPGDRRDPFVLDVESVDSAPAAASGIAPDPLRRKEELEQYALDAMRMVGTLEQQDTTWGLISVPDGTLHRVQVGNYMGLNNGQITRITEEGIELTEIVSDGNNEWREQPAEIALSE
jgi:type IV pilus assembly protein PilP